MFLNYKRSREMLSVESGLFLSALSSPLLDVYSESRWTRVSLPLDLRRRLPFYDGTSTVHTSMAAKPCSISHSSASSRARLRFPLFSLLLLPSVAILESGSRFEAEGANSEIESFAAPVPSAVVVRCCALAACDISDEGERRQ
jgi:hypothetical protein